MWNQSEIDYDLWLLLCELCLLSLLIANLIDLASLKHPKPTDNVNRSEWTTIRVNHHHSQSVFELRANKSFWYSMLSTSPRVSEWMTFLICIWTWRHHHLRIRYSAPAPQTFQFAWIDGFRLSLRNRRTIFQAKIQIGNRIDTQCAIKITHKWLWCEFAFVVCVKGIDAVTPTAPQFDIQNFINDFNRDAQRMAVVTQSSRRIRHHTFIHQHIFHPHPIHIHFIRIRTSVVTHSNVAPGALDTHCVRNFLLSNANNIHTIKLLQIVKSMNSISDGTRAQLYPKRIGYVRRTFTKQIHLYSIGSAKWLEHFSLANWAIRKSAISFFAIFSLYFSSFRSSLGIFYCIFLVAFAEVDAR